MARIAAVIIETTVAVVSGIVAPRGGVVAALRFVGPRPGRRTGFMAVAMAMAFPPMAVAFRFMVVAVAVSFPRMAR